jgi:hypothetical protein
MISTRMQSHSITVRCQQGGTIHFSLSNVQWQELGLPNSIPSAPHKMIAFQATPDQNTLAWIGLLPNFSKSNFSLCLLVIENARTLTPTCYFWTPLVQGSWEYAQTVGYSALNLLNEEYPQLTETVNGEVLGFPNLLPLPIPVIGSL